MNDENLDPSTLDPDMFDPTTVKGETEELYQRLHGLYHQMVNFRYYWLIYCLVRFRFISMYDLARFTGFTREKIRKIAQEYEARYGERFHEGRINILDQEYDEDD